ncbi:hypothetical protein HZA56_19640 [Candidatus Poribacteria bacterium]|nr:hypothetical protein [Candidatus Poribacteria bacterium]
MAKRNIEKVAVLPMQAELDFKSERATAVNTGTPPIDSSFPESAANELATLESFNKHLYRPNSYLHKWWARRSGTTFRHILKQLVPDPANRGYYEPGGLEGKLVLDPMMGGGTILHEAIRMGANVLGADIDPVPVLQAMATLTSSPLAHKESAFKGFFDQLRENLFPLYKTACPTCDREAEIQFVLYGLRRACSCGEALFVDDLILREGNHHNEQICSVCHGVHHSPRHKCGTQKDRPLIVKGVRQCRRCNEQYKEILEEPFSERYVPLVVVGNCPLHKQFFKSVGKDDLRLINEAKAQSASLDFGDPAKLQIHGGPKSGDLLKRRISSYQDLFAPRQLLYLDTARRLLSNAKPQDRLWLALLISTSLEFNSILCGYKGSSIRRPGAIRHVFSHHAYSFPYTALENNPIFLGNTSGTLKRLFNDRVVKAGEWSVAPIEMRIVNGHCRKVAIRGELDGGEPVSDFDSLLEGKRRFRLMQTDSAKLDIPEGMVDYVVTDPPYYDNVQYSDLSNFFRVWLQLLLPRKANWRYDSLASAVSEGCPSSGKKYGDVLARIWERCFNALNKDHGRLIFSFHHWSDEAWAELTLSLKRARFTLINCYVVFSENPISVHIRSLKALKHDAILVLKPVSNRKELSHWPKQAAIATDDSYRFCRDCGAALGYFLNSEKDEEQIRNEWKTLLTGENIGKTSGRSVRASN